MKFGWVFGGFVVADGVCGCSGGVCRSTGVFAGLGVDTGLVWVGLVLWWGLLFYWIVCGGGDVGVSCFEKHEKTGLFESCFLCGARNGT